MIYRFLDPGEYAVLDAVYAANGYTSHVPDAEVSRTAVVESDGKIVAGMVGQLLLQLGPLWVDPNFRGEADLRRLHRMHEKFMGPGKRYFAFAENEFTAGLCKAGGMELMKDWQVFRKELPL